MLPTIQKILYATDLSDNSRRAFVYAAGLAQRYGARMLVLHVMEPISQNTYMQISTLMREADWKQLELQQDSQFTEEILSKLRDFCRELQKDAESFEPGDDGLLVRKGYPVNEIMKLAAEQSVDLIVMGTHGYGLVKDSLMGGTVRRLVHHSKIPVLVVPNPHRTLNG